ncbi:hypothetical protein F4678DRAFT_453617 [Xylaria arbuscula]|nr:hypothetical protein F4678DRAFT_453617 [Xylaria arbuscula]
MMTRSQARELEVQPGWPSLPAEIRLMILNFVASAQHRGWGSLASVCRQWQFVLEKANFSKLKLSGSARCLDKFERITGANDSKRRLIRHICLEVRLPRYTSECCASRTGRPQDLRQMGSTVGKWIWRLFSILGTWEPTGNGLVLEINAYSPSDGQHWFKNMYWSSSDYDCDDGSAERTETWRAGRQYHDPQHGWIHGRQVTRPPSEALTNLFMPMYLKFPAELPRVDAVTCLVVRRQLRHSLSPISLGELLGSLRRLESISYEPWVSLQDPCGRYWDKRVLVAALQDHPLPATLNKLTIFEDDYTFYDRFPSLPLPAHWFTTPNLHNELDAKLASKSRDLHYIAISFMVNAEDFFRYCRPEWTWPRLQTLALTSPLLRQEKRSLIEPLLCRVSILVRNMPKLHTLVLWNAKKGHTCAFIYRRSERNGASITWRGTWSLALSPGVINSWRSVGLESHGFEFSELQVKCEQVQGVIASHGDAIHHLDLPCRVIEPASLWQIRREGYGLPK